MNDTLRVLGNNPEIGLTTSIGTGIIQCLNILNPILTFISLTIGISIGILTLYKLIKGGK
ncbi:MAG: hypothetical protein Tp152DCM46671_42 [Prokaryotic dsDNA virus sp.]|nr:MAG: hypothetical protein Tp152DCM46671_42 [Prokaryotic dsDNA virus sp.]|tara:strand:- start:38018 stop:38197 length:180 start_codon:yes stop_codon:yes gene_type:complete